MKVYIDTVKEVLERGVRKENRTGVDTISAFNINYTIDMDNGFPLLTTKKIYFKHAVTELLWILQGRTDMHYLQSNGVNYWNPDYERSGRSDGTLGPVYGKQLRDFNGVDQLKRILVKIKRYPSSRRIMASLWNPNDLADMVLPPCHYNFQVYINDGKMDLMWQQRSVDVFLGLPYDIAMYGLLLLMLAEGLGYKPGTLIGQLGDCHLYNNHLDQASLQLSREPKKLPTVDVQIGLKLMEDNKTIFVPSHNNIKLNNYKCHEAIKAPLSVG